MMSLRASSAFGRLAQRSRLGLILAGTAASASAPSSTPPSTPSETVTLWHSYSGAERAALERVVQRFEATKPGFRVALSAVPHEVLTPKLSAAMPRGHGPDLFIYAHDRIGGWAEGGLIQPLELFATETMLDAHLTPCVFALAYGESLYGLPLAYKALALFVRTDLVPDPPRTFEALLSAAKAATDPREGRYGFVYGNAELFTHTPLLFSLGGFIFEGRRINVVNEGVFRSFALAHRLAKVEKIVPDEPSFVTTSAMFSDGRTPMVMSGPWFRSEIPASTPYTVVPLPAFPGGRGSSGFSTCEGVLMNAKSRRRTRAWTFMKFLANDLRSAEVRLRVAGQPVTLRAAYDEALRSLPEREQAIIRGFRAAFEQSVPSPSDPSMAAAWMPMDGALYRVIHQAADPRTAAVEAQARIDQALRALK
ncbi:MAG: extracellular solute-binding protein [Deltaproteobacteria bacterium]|nr:extracellular solute-binding protein [Deltaproteobacteria bacterium]